MNDIFQLRASVKVLDYLRRSSWQEDKDLAHVFDIKDIRTDVWNELDRAFKELETGRGRGISGQSMVNAFWLNYCDDEDYSGPARCFVNPPTVLLTTSQDSVSVHTHDGYGHVGTTFNVIRDRGDKQKKALVFNSIQGEEQGFFNEVIVFCDGRISPEVAKDVAELLAEHILPTTTALIFEMPNNDNGLWLSLLGVSPSDDVKNLLQALMIATEFSFQQIDVKSKGPRTTLYFGVQA